MPSNLQFGGTKGSGGGVRSTPWTNAELVLVLKFAELLAWSLTSGVQVGNLPAPVSCSGPYIEDMLCCIRQRAAEERILLVGIEKGICDMSSRKRFKLEGDQKERSSRRETVPASHHSVPSILPHERLDSVSHFQLCL